MQQMETVTQGTAATAEETAAASEELNAQAEVTMASASNLHVLVTGAQREVQPVRRRASSPARIVKMTGIRAPKVADNFEDFTATGTYGA